jgi:ubiquinone/menaquinone biosynthesis methyltransferase
MRIKREHMAYEVNDSDPGDKKKNIRNLFDAIVPTYDLLNRLLSLGTDRIWRMQAVKELAPLANKKVLDLCCGTGDMSLLLRRKGAKTFSIDFSRQMVLKGVEKKRLDKRTTIADASRLPYKEESCDAAAIAFGIRNIPDLNLFLKEVQRVLVPGGRFLILELVRPRHPLVKVLYFAYLKGYLPIIGRLVSGNPDAYAYLAGTIATFIDFPSLKTLLKDHGFDKIRFTPKTMGVAAVITATLTTPG